MDKRGMGSGKMLAAEEYAQYEPMTRHVQANLRQDVELLKGQEGWDEETWRGVEEWVDDLGSIWRTLRRNRYDSNKANTVLLSALSARLELCLHARLASIPTYTDPSLFYILPLPQHKTRHNRPIAVLTPREVRRDDEGSLEELKEYVWWGLEMCRRVVQDWWVRGLWDGMGDDGRGRGGPPRGAAGEGVVLLVDASGAGYRNLEVDLLPTLVSVGNKHFPSLIEAVYIVNTGWTHQGMWGIVRHLLPKSALDRVTFLSSQKELETAFELDRLPKAFGGTSDYTFSPSDNPIYTYYTHHRSSPFHPAPSDVRSSSAAPSRSLSRIASATSIADIYYTAQNSPFTSHGPTPSGTRRGSLLDKPIVGLGLGLGGGNGLKMTKNQEEKPVALIKAKEKEETDSTIVRVASRPNFVPYESTPEVPLSSNTSGRASPSETRETTRHNSPNRSPLPSTFLSTDSQDHLQGLSAVQRIKSLSDFHLYLSPSRLAKIDLLSDSDPEDEDPGVPPMPVMPQPRKALRPALLEKRLTDTLAPGSGKTGVEGGDSVESYKGQLRNHHARGLEEWLRTPQNLGLDSVAPDRVNNSQEEKEGEEDDPVPQTITVSPVNRPISPEFTLEPSRSISPPPSPPSRARRHPQPATLTYSSTNPFFGYPVVQSDGQILPRYPRRRKRDLVKTLLFLFLLKIQSWRGSLERVLPQLHLFPFSRPRGPSSLSFSPARNPTEGLLRPFHTRTPGGGRDVSKRLFGWSGVLGDKDWWYMLIGMLLFRGSWGRLVWDRLEMVGLVPFSGS